MQTSRLAPGLLLVVALGMAAYLLVELPGLSFLGVLMTSLLVGMAWQAILGTAERQQPGIEFSVRVLLKVGVVLLGSRLQLDALIGIGPTILIGSILIVGGGVFVVERLCRAVGVGRPLSLAIAVGTSICGASAILACGAATRLKREDVGVAVAVISLVGAVAAIAFAILGNVLSVDPLF